VEINSDSYRAEVGANGRFAFTNLPSGKFRLFNLRWGTALFSRTLARTSVRLGDTNSVTVSTYTVTAHPRLPGDTPPPEDVEFRLQMRLQEKPLREPVQLTRAADGVWKAEDLPAGVYTLQVF
jgi:hypothetical protein